MNINIAGIISNTSRSCSCISFYMSFLINSRCSSVQIHRTLYRRHCWLLIGKEHVNGIVCPRFGQVVDILTRGELQSPQFVIRSGHTIACLQCMRAYKVELLDSVSITLVHPSSLLYSYPLTVIKRVQSMSSRLKLIYMHS